MFDNVVIDTLELSLHQPVFVSVLLVVSVLLQLVLPQLQHL